MSVEAEDRVMECLDMANDAARKADGAASPGEAQFWRRMEQRWLRLAKTYHDTDQLITAWRAPRADQPGRSGP